MTILTQEEAQQLLDLFGPNGEHWGKHHFERDGKFCFYGACLKIGLPVIKYYHLQNKMNLLTKNDSSVWATSLIHWNDHPKRTFKDICDFIKQVSELPLPA